MLILTRAVGDTIEIAEGAVEIVVLGMKGGNVRLGLKAPAQIKILRGEVANADRLKAHHSPPAEKTALG